MTARSTDCIRENLVELLFVLLFIASILSSLELLNRFAGSLHVRKASGRWMDHHSQFTC
jgi:hypothetical protein